MSLLVDLGITVATGKGVTGIPTSSYYHKTISKDLSNGIDNLATSISTLQAQLESQAAVVLQNRRGLKLLTADKGGLCIFLDEECCFYFNQSGLVQDAVKKTQRSSPKDQGKQLLYPAFLALLVS